jgi:hypothetical protein
VAQDFGGPIGLPLGLDESHDVTALVVLNTWMWPLDNDPQIVKAGRQDREKAFEVADA